MSNFTKADLKTLGLVQQPNGRYKKEKVTRVEKVAQKGLNEPVTFIIDPMGKPRMTRQDKWRTDPFHKDPKKRQRPVVTRYWQWKRQINILADAEGFVFPESGTHIIFTLQMPRSWSKKIKEEMIGKPHQQKPDLDNMVKGVKDSLLEEDSHIWDYRLSKYWGTEGSIKISYLK